MAPQRSPPSPITFIVHNQKSNWGGGGGGMVPIVTQLDHTDPIQL